MNPTQNISSLTSLIPTMPFVDCTVSTVSSFAVVQLSNNPFKTIKDIAQELIDMDNDYSLLPKSSQTIIIKSIETLAILNLCRAGWQKTMLTPTEAIAVNQIASESLDQIRKGLCIEKTITDDRIDIELQSIRKKEQQTMADELQERNKVVLEPNWPFPCKRCNQKKIYYWTAQTRSSDEAATVFYKCLACGYETRDS